MLILTTVALIYGLSNVNVGLSKFSLCFHWLKHLMQIAGIQFLKSSWGCSLDWRSACLCWILNWPSCTLACGTCFCILYKVEYMSLNHSKACVSNYGVKANMPHFIRELFQIFRCWVGILTMSNNWHCSD